MLTSKEGRLTVLTENRVVPERRNVDNVDCVRVVEILKGLFLSPPSIFLLRARKQHCQPSCMRSGSLQYSVARALSEAAPELPDNPFYIASFLDRRRRTSRGRPRSLAPASCRPMANRSEEIVFRFLRKDSTDGASRTQCKAAGPAVSTTDSNRAPGCRTYVRTLNGAGGCGSSRRNRAHRSKRAGAPDRRRAFQGR